MDSEIFEIKLIQDVKILKSFPCYSENVLNKIMRKYGQDCREDEKEIVYKLSHDDKFCSETVIMLDPKDPQLDKFPYTSIFKQGLYDSKNSLNIHEIKRECGIFFVVNDILGQLLSKNGKKVDLKIKTIYFNNKGFDILFYDSSYDYIPRKFISNNKVFIEDLKIGDMITCGKTFYIFLKKSYSKQPLFINLLQEEIKIDDKKFFTTDFFKIKFEPDNLL